MDYLILGKIVNTRGLKGEVKILNYSDFSNLRYKQNHKIQLYDELEDKYFKLTIESFQILGEIIFLTFKEIKSIEEANKLKNNLLIIYKKDVHDLAKENYYHYELLNLEVYYKNNKIGIVSEIFSNSAQDLLRIQEKEKNFLVPFMEEFVKEVNLKENKIILTNIEGLR